MRALIATLLVFAALPGTATAMTLMTEDLRVFDDLKGSPLSEHGYTVAEQMGVRMMRYHRGLEGGVDRETGAQGPPDVALYRARVDGWLSDVLRRGFVPYLAISIQPESYVRMPSTAEFGHWCADVAARYGDRIRDFAVWNEPNNRLWGPLLMGDPARYNRLYRACYTAIKAATRGAAKVYYGEIDAHTADPCAWVENSLDDGGETLADGIAIHTYQWRTPPDRPDGTYCQGIGRLDDWNAEKRSWAQRGLLRTPEGDEPPLLVTEHGYCAPHGECPAVEGGADNAIASEAERARLIRDAFLFAESRGVTVFSLYHLFNQPDAPGPLWDTGVLDAVTGLATLSVCALREVTSVRLISLDRDLARWDPGPLGCG
jgi:hypothetical protein